jgi:hypothetical protein
MFCVNLSLSLSASCTWDGVRGRPPQLVLNVHWTFPQCALRVPSESLLNLPWMRTEYSLNVHWMFPECAPNVPWITPNAFWMLWVSRQNLELWQTLLTWWCCLLSARFTKCFLNHTECSLNWTKCSLHHPICSLNFVGAQAAIGTLADPAGHDGATRCERHLLRASRPEADGQMGPSGKFRKVRNVPWMFPKWSLNVPWMFLECSLYVP